MHKLATATALLAIVASAPAFAYERWFDVYNDGATAIRSVYATHVDDPDWGPDLLGDYVIPEGSFLTVEPRRSQGYCSFDVKIVYQNQSELTLNGVDLCTATQIAANDRGWTSICTEETRGGKTPPRVRKRCILPGHLPILGGGPRE